MFPFLIGSERKFQLCCAAATERNEYVPFNRTLSPPHLACFDVPTVLFHWPFRAVPRPLLRLSTNQLLPRPSGRALRNVPLDPRGRGGEEEGCGGGSFPYLLHRTMSFWQSLSLRVATASLGIGGRAGSGGAVMSAPRGRGPVVAPRGLQPRPHMCPPRPAAALLPQQPPRCSPRGTASAEERPWGEALAVAGSPRGWGAGRRGRRAEGPRCGTAGCCQDAGALRHAAEVRRALDRAGTRAGRAPPSGRRGPGADDGPGSRAAGGGRRAGGSARLPWALSEAGHEETRRPPASPRADAPLRSRAGERGRGAALTTRFSRGPRPLRSPRVPHPVSPLSLLSSRSSHVPHSPSPRPLVSPCPHPPVSPIHPCSHLPVSRSPPCSSIPPVPLSPRVPPSPMCPCPPCPPCSVSPMPCVCHPPVTPFPCDRRPPCPHPLVVPHLPCAPVRLCPPRVPPSPKAHGPPSSPDSPPHSVQGKRPQPCTPRVRSKVAPYRRQQLPPTAGLSAERWRCLGSTVSSRLTTFSSSGLWMERWRVNFASPIRVTVCQGDSRLDRTPGCG